MIMQSVYLVNSMNMVKSRLLGKNTLSSTIIGVVPQEAAENEVTKFCLDSHCLKMMSLLSIILIVCLWAGPCF